MVNTIGWELYRTFLAVLTEGSLSGAARALGITQPTAGRHIAALETAFGQPLFIRSRTGLSPTEGAISLRGYAEAMRDTAAALERAATSRGQEVTGTVRISASEVIGTEVLPPMLARLKHAHPQLRIELVPTNRVQDLLRREADIAVRMTQPRQESLIARRVGDVKLGLYAHNDYLRRHGMPAIPADLTRHALIGFDEETPYLRAASRQLPIWTRDAFAFRTDSDLAQLALIRAGCGIGICQTALAGGLVRVLPEQYNFTLATWVTLHEDLRASPRCKATFDALVLGLRNYTGESG
ncbi:LysR family transcriptional regulator [Acerihabitans sp.]|uniref:LysR family transcriptional regulator n=1 Tax=Acerihabitans sp. TaxID=2811394 RepID=UPI002ED82012